MTVPRGRELGGLLQDHQRPLWGRSRPAEWVFLFKLPVNRGLLSAAPPSPHLFQEVHLGEIKPKS